MTYGHPHLTAERAAAHAGLRLARHALSLPLPAATPESAPPEWVHLIPAGAFSGRDGRGPYTLDAKAVLAAFAAHGADLPVDYDHQSLTADEKAGPVPAAGWIKELALRQRLRHILIAIDQLAWVVLTLGRGYPDETISAAAYRMEQQGKLAGRILRPTLDLLFRPLETNHCLRSYESEQKNTHLPPAYLT